MNQVVNTSTNPLLEKKVGLLEQQGIKVKKITKIDATKLGLDKHEPVSIGDIIGKLSLKINEIPYICENFNIYVLELTR